MLRGGPNLMRMQLEERPLTREMFFIGSRRRKKRGSHYGVTRYRRFPGIRPSRASQFATKRRQRILTHQGQTELIADYGRGSLIGDLSAATQGVEEAAGRLATRM